MINVPLPKFLLMENVNAITSPKHNPNFVQWQEELESMGYTNKVYKGLNAFGFWCSTITIQEPLCYRLEIKI